DEEDLVAVASDDVVVAADAEGGGAGALDGHALGHGQGAAGRDGAAEAGCEHDGIARVRRGQHVGKRPGAAGVEVQDRIHGRGPALLQALDLGPDPGRAAPRGGPGPGLQQAMEPGKSHDRSSPGSCTTTGVALTPGVGNVGATGWSPSSDRRLST